MYIDTIFSFLFLLGENSPNRHTNRNRYFRPKRSKFFALFKSFPVEKYLIFFCRHFADLFRVEILT